MRDPRARKSELRHQLACGSLTRHWSSVGGILIHARLSVGPVPSDRIPVVLVHGLGMSSDYMVPLARQLAADFRVYVPDQPGFGSSGKPASVLDIVQLADFIAEWARTLRLGTVALLGNSLGCQIAAACAARHPEQVQKLILQGPTGDPQGHSWGAMVVRWLLNAGRERSSPTTVVKEYRRAGFARVRRTSRFGLEDQIGHQLCCVRAPTLVVHGARDPITPQRWAEEVTNLLPNGRLIVVPGAAHTMNHYAALELARVVRPFLLEAHGEVS